MTAETPKGSKPSGNVDLREELKGDFAAVELPVVPDVHVEGALQKLRAQTKEGLNAEDHHDLGLAYIGMGLVDDAVREFNLANKGDRKPRGGKKTGGIKAAKKRGTAPAKQAKARKGASKKRVAKRAGGKGSTRKASASKSAARKGPARKVSASKGAATQRTAPKKPRPTRRKR